MPRTSARLKEKIENRPPAHHPCNTTTQTVAKASTSRPQKKQKSKAAVHGTVSDSTQSKIKGKKGKLRNMTKMPIDILFEVFGQLEPVDLLHLSRATKDLRAILITSNATFLWKRAYQNLNHPPPCPPEVNLRHYTNFLYGRNCHFCGSVYGTILHYTARVRLCRICATKCLTKYNTNQKNDLEVKALHLCPYSHIWIPQLANGGYVLNIEFEQKLRALQARKHDPVALDAFCHEQEGLQLERHQYARKIEKYLDEFRKKYLSAISQRIYAEGYGKELRSFQITRLPGIETKATAELSDQDWERIKPRLIEVLEYKRQENLKEEMMYNFKTRIQHLSKIVTNFHSKTPQPFVIPPTVHFVRTAPFSDLMKNTSMTQQAFANNMRNLTSHIPNITASWRKLADQCLLHLLPQKSTSRGRKGKGKGKGKEIVTSRLELATTFFRCHWCREPISYPRILMHRCLRDRPLDDPEEEESEDDVDTDEDERDDGEGEGEECKHLPMQKNPPQNVVDSVWSKMSSWYGADWNEGDDQVTFDDEASGFAQVIVKACGEDPDMVTLDRMNEIDARVECLRCRGRKKLVMNWTTAILHDLGKHFEEAPDEKGWLLISSEDAIKAKDLEAERSHKWPNYHLPCNLELPSHFYLPLDTLMKRPPYAVRI